jgi:hypothetical protein
VASSPSTAPRSPLAAAVEEEATKATNPVQPAARTATLPPTRPPTTTAKGVAITASPAQKRPAEKEDRTQVVPAGSKPAPADDETDFTSIIDNLGD